MVSGLNNKLLTIAIPTWNRAVKLQTALDILLPQIIEFKDDIEFIISDNASNDNTTEIVSIIKNKHSDFACVYYKQHENTGFFGNFHKCYELGTGKYFWLLSDDDYIFEGVIEQIINILRNNEVGAIFLNDWTINENLKQKLESEFVNKKDFFSNRPYRHSLISSVIHRHNVKGNDMIFEELKGNALIGYAVFLKAIYSYNKFAIIHGNALMVRNDSIIRFDALHIFTYDVNEIVEYINNFYDKKVITKIINSFLKTNISKHFKSYRFENKYKNNNANFVFFKKFYPYLNFWIFVFPFFLIPISIYKCYTNTNVKLKDAIKKRISQ